MHLLVALKGGEDIKELIIILVDTGADVNAQDNAGNTPLHWAVGVNQQRRWLDSGNHKGIKILLQLGADPRASNKQGLSPVEIALRSPSREYRQELENAGVKPRFIDKVRTLI